MLKRAIESRENAGQKAKPAEWPVTSAPAQASNTDGIQPEFGRWRDVQRLFGIKRGTLYNLMAEGKIKSVVLRRRGNLHGCRLFHLESIRQYLNSLLEDQQPQ